MNLPQAQLHFRSGYFSDAQAFAALVDLLKDVFDIDIGLLDRFGGPDPSCMPFGYFDATGRCVANFSAFSMPLVIDGRKVRAVGYQSGAVRPDFRGQGLFRDLMQRAFAWAESQHFELGILLTDKPNLYQPYGFQTVTQHAFHCEASERLEPVRQSKQPARRLSVNDVDDIALIRRLLVARQPVSDVFAVAGHATEFLLNACFDPDIRLTYLQQSETVVAWKHLGEGGIALLDIVAAEIPPLATILAGLEHSGGEVIVHFPPDRLDWREGQPRLYKGYCDLMIKAMVDGPLPVGFSMLSPMAEF